MVEEKISWEDIEQKVLEKGMDLVDAAGDHAYQTLTDEEATPDQYQRALDVFEQTYETVQDMQGNADPAYRQE